MRPLLWLFVAFACVFSAAADPVITEFMASNKKGITDEDGDHSDWIEIHNPDATPVNLAGWSLTDSASTPQKWIFPAVTLPANGYLIVFASGKNRRVVGAPLHASFSLAAGGEYLGLVKPDGITRTTEFKPQFPAQLEDISYGISSSLQTVTLLQAGSAARAFAATSAQGTTWRDRLFDDGAWLSGTQPVGFFNYGKTSNPNLNSTLGLDLKAALAGRIGSAYVRLPFMIPDPANVQRMRLRVNYDDGFAAFLNGQTVGTGNSPTVATLTYSSLALGVRAPTAHEEFDATSLIPELVAGTNVLAVQILNESTTSSDLYAVAELTAEIDTGVTPVIGYFRTATPGAQNGGPESIQLPQTITPSRPPGTFTEAFSLALSGAAAGQQIRYVLASPSSSPGAAIPEPTIASPLYSDPISISSSRLIRAAVFDPVTGQRGNTLTLEYLWLETGSTNNTSNFTSTLPILVGDNHGAGQPVDSSTGTYTTSLLHLFAPVDGVSSLNATPSLFIRGGLRVRGKSSQNFPKKSYAIETWDESDNDFKMPLLGLAKESDWILNGPWGYDNTFIHNAFLYELARRCGRWAPRTQFVEMFTSSNGGKLDYTDYAGVYVLTEKIEVGSGRLNLTGIEPGEISGGALTGGYVFKWDLPDPDEVNWKTIRGIPSEDTTNIIVEPDSDDDTEEQVDYIKNYIQSFENALYTDAATGFSTRNYRHYVDVASWVDFHILNIFAFNVDAVRLSTFYHKDRNEKINAGPPWDFDRALGSDNGHDANPRTWGDSTLINRYFVINWWGRMFKDPDFVQAWIDRWWELRGGVFSNANLNALADALGGQIGNVIGARDAARWANTTSGNSKTGNTPISGSFLGEIDRMKTWMTATSGGLGRAPWIDSQLPAPPTASVASGVVASGTTVTLSGADAIRFTVNGTDPRAPGGSSAPGNATYSAPLTITQTTTLVARRQGAYSPFPSAASTAWSAPLRRVYLVNEAFAGADDIAISEILYRPADPTAAEIAAFPGGVSAGDFEFIELRNVGNRVVNTFEMKFVNQTPFKELTLAPLSLAPGDTALVVKNREAFLARFGNQLAPRIVGEWVTGSLANDGERILLLARDGTTAVDLTYSDDAEAGMSLNRIGGAWRSDVPSPRSIGPTYAQWKSFYFAAGGPGTGDDDDFDSDEVDNRTEYVRASNPLVKEPATWFEPTFKLSNDGASFIFTFAAAANRPSAEVVAEQSVDLVHWTPATAVVASTAAGVETRAVQVPVAGGDRFFRLRTALSP